MYDEKFNTVIDFILQSEGGWNKDSKIDHGGTTDKGITQNTYNSWNTRHNKPLKNVKGITKKETTRIS